MPRCNGFELLRSVRADAALNEVPVVVFSTLGMDSDKKRAADLGANAYWSNRLQRRRSHGHRRPLHRPHGELRRVRDETITVLVMKASHHFANDLRICSGPTGAFIWWKASSR